jgi:hypothetical protein
MSHSPGPWRWDGGLLLDAAGKAVAVANDDYGILMENEEADHALTGCNGHLEWAR